MQTKEEAVNALNAYIATLDEELKVANNVTTLTYDNRYHHVAAMKQSPDGGWDGHDFHQKLWWLARLHAHRLLAGWGVDYLTLARLRMVSIDIPSDRTKEFKEISNTHDPDALALFLFASYEHLYDVSNPGIWEPKLSPEMEKILLIATEGAMANGNVVMQLHNVRGLENLSKKEKRKLNRELDRETEKALAALQTEKGVTREELWRRHADEANTVVTQALGVVVGKRGGTVTPINLGPGAGATVH
jgi:hypothetical protein